MTHTTSRVPSAFLLLSLAECAVGPRPHGAGRSFLPLPIGADVCKGAHAMARRTNPISPDWAEHLYPSISPMPPTRGLAAEELGKTELMPHGHTPDDIRNWLKALGERLSITPTELARDADIAPSTINRFLIGKGQYNLSAATIDKITSAALRLADRRGGELVGRIDPPPDSGRPGRAGEQTFELRRYLVEVPVIGRVETGLWREAVEYPPQDRYNVHAVVEGAYRRLPIVALDVHGDGMNKEYPDGSIVICVPFSALDRLPSQGERVVVNQKNDSAIETTVKQFTIDPMHNAWLLPLSTSPQYRPIFLGSGYPTEALYLAEAARRPFAEPEANQYIDISLLVIASYRPERTEMADLRKWRENHQ